MIKIKMINWKPIPDYEGFYEVSDDGQVRSVDRIIITKAGVKRKQEGKLLSQAKDKDGYPKVQLNKEGKGKTWLIHKLVSLAFLENTDSKPCVNHKNGVKTDNNVSNLEWATVKENTIHMYEKLNTGRTQKLTASNIREIKKLLSEGKMSGAAIAREFGVDRSQIYRIKSGHIWGYIN